MCNEIKQTFEERQHESQYQSYLLRLWRVGTEKAWRVMLEHVGTHERRGFIDLEDLCAFLCEQMNDQGKREKSLGSVCSKSTRRKKSHPNQQDY